MLHYHLMPEPLGIVVSEMIDGVIIRICIFEIPFSAVMAILCNGPKTTLIAM